MGVGLCVCVCVRALAWACVCACLHTCMNVHARVCVRAALKAPQHAVNALKTAAGLPSLPAQPIITLVRMICFAKHPGKATPQSFECAHAGPRTSCRHCCGCSGRQWTTTSSRASCSQPHGITWSCCLSFSLLRACRARACMARWIRWVAQACYQAFFAAIGC